MPRLAQDRYCSSIDNFFILLRIKKMCEHHDMESMDKLRLLCSAGYPWLYKEGHCLEASTNTPVWSHTCTSRFNYDIPSCVIQGITVHYHLFYTYSNNAQYIQCRPWHLLHNILHVASMVGPKPTIVVLYYVIQYQFLRYPKTSS